MPRRQSAARTLPEGSVVETTPWPDSPDVAAIAARFPAITHDDLRVLLRELVPLTSRALSATFGRLLNTADLEDVLAEAFAILWFRKEQYSVSKGTLSRYYFGIAKKRALSLLRARERERVAREGEQGDAEEPGPFPVTAAQLALPVVHRALSEFRTELSAEDAALMDYYADHHEESRWAADYAEANGLSASPVRVRVFRLRRRLVDRILKAVAEAEELDSGNEV